MSPWTVACQAPLSMGFPKQEYWNGLPFPFPGDLPNPEIEPLLLKSPELAGRFFSFTEGLQTYFLHKQKKKEKTVQLKQGLKDLNRHISKEYIQMAKVYKKMTTAPVIKKCTLKPQKYHLTSLRISVIKI